MKTQHRIDKALETGYEFQPSRYISKAWDTFKDYPGHFIGFMLIMGILSMLIGLIPYVSQIYSISVGAALGLGFGIFTYMTNVHKDESFERFFGGLKFILPVTVTGIIQGLIFLVIASPLIYIFREPIMELMEDSSPENIMEIAENFSGGGVWVFAVGILVIYASVTLRWAPLLVVFHDYTPLEAIKTSFALVNKNLPMHLLLFVLFILVSILGVLALVVGLLAAIPVIQVAEYYGFAEVTGLEDEVGNEINEMDRNDGHMF
jgi:hypothetical protein